MSVIINPGGGSGSGVTGPYRVSTLPPGMIGMMAYVTDGIGGQAWGSTIVGGGNARYLVWFNGANWTVVGDGGYAPGGTYVPTYPEYGF